MLYELSVENFALIQGLSLPLSPGFNALTGETGAGKSLIVDAMALLTGGKANENLIRSGCNRCRVEGVFAAPYPDELYALLDGYWDEESPEDTLIVSRELSRGGRGVCRINGRAVNLSLLKQAGKLLINIHGQHEHMLLLEEDKQTQLLDSFGGDNQTAAKEATAAAFAAWQQAKSDLAAYENDKQGRSQRLDWLTYQIDEIENAGLRPGEEEELEEESQRLDHGEKLLQLSDQAHQALEAAGLNALHQAAANFRQAAAWDKQAAALSDRLESLYYEAEDCQREISSYRLGVNADPYRLEEVENRLAQIGRLKKKYGASVDDILHYLETAKEEQAALAETEISGPSLSAREEAAAQDYRHKAEYLSLLRQKTALMLGEAVTGELQKLAMPQAVFRVDLPSCPPGPGGMEKAQFMVCSNVGETFLPVAKVASGGELSRIVLGLKVVLCQLDQVPTLIFDEVDTGLSGRALDAVAERLAVVGRHTQTLVVSHGAVMAAAAGRQIHIRKEVIEGRTVVSAREQTGEARIEEIARMIAGNNITPTTRRQAKEMLAVWHNEAAENET
ncbi:MAG: DNA repair protein RecN [Firmicutes bacterium]|nr:DNA repair protein RecN [Bacillota bacterium]